MSAPNSPQPSPSPAPEPVQPPAPEPQPAPPEYQRPSRAVPAVIGTLVALLLALLVVMRQRADDQTNKVALAQSAKPVTVVRVQQAMFQPMRTYVGTLEPWVEAKVGPQFVSAYVSTVLVRPGAVVKKGAVLATLDCRSASAVSQAIEMQARALDAQQRALANEASRINGMLDGGFVSTTEAEGKSAQSEAKQAELLATKAKLLDTSLQVSDCVLRAPFDGEVASRWLDPGAFARPGQPIVSLIDRSVVRFVADVPEGDFEVVPPGKEGSLRVYSTGAEVPVLVARRAPAADPATRTVHVEVDLADKDHRIPVFTTGELTVGVGQAQPALELPLASATIRGKKVTVYTVEGDVAHAKPLVYQGESGGSVFVDAALPTGALVVTEGRALLSDGDRVSAKTEPAPAPTQVAGP